MAIKKTVYLYCQKCGEQIAHIRGDHVSCGRWCPCTEAPPGPQNPPRLIPLRDVIVDAVKPKGSP